MTARVLLIIAVVGLFPLFLEARVSECGTYQVEGKVIAVSRTDGKGALRFIANEGAYSQIEFVLTDDVAIGTDLHPGLRAGLVFEIPKRCDFICGGTLLRVEKILDPWRKAKLFTARTKPSPAAECQN